MPQLDPTRAQRITASIVPKLMSGDVAAIQNLWLRAIGDPRYVPDDFEGSWAAYIGQAIETPNIDWHEKKTGHAITRRQQQVFHPDRDYVSATLDGWREHDNTVIDHKFIINPVRSIEAAAEYYTPQMVVQQDCVGASRAALLICKGGAEPIEVPVYFDEPYRRQVWNTIDQFWDCVISLTPPVELSFPRIVPPAQWRRIDLDNDSDLPNWSEEMRALLATWTITIDEAKLNERAKSDIKRIFPDDCGQLVCADAIIVRTRSNAVSIKKRGGRE